MTNTIDNKFSTINDAMTDRLDGLESSLPTIPSKTLGATRATARRFNDVMSSAVRSVAKRFSTIGASVSTASSTTAGQAEHAADATAKAARRAGATTAGQARAAVEKTVESVTRGAKETIGQAKAQATNVGRTAKGGAKAAVGQARAQAERTASVAGTQLEGALDDARLATDPDDLTELTKSDLYDRAQDLEIEGRSTMTKAELVSALQQA